MEKLLYWAIQHGAQLNDNLKLQEDRRVSVEKEIAAGRPLLSIPYDLVITPKLARSVLGLQQSVKSRDALILYLLSEAGSEVHRPYIDSLPKSFPGIPYHWPTEHWDLLLGTNLYGAGLARLEGIKSAHASLSSSISIKVPFERYLWAHSVITSRAFSLTLLHEEVEASNSGPPDEILLPLLDMLDHEPMRPMEWIGDPVSRTVTFRSPSAVDPTSSLTNNYGPKSNEELLLGYGFTIPANPFDTVALKLGNSPQLAQNRVVQELERRNEFTGVYHISNFKRDDRTCTEYISQFPWQLLAIFRSTCLSEQEAQYESNHLLDSIDDMYCGQVIPGIMTEQYALESLADLLQAKLMALEASEEVFEKVVGVEESVRRTVQQCRQGQATVLQNAINGLLWVSNQLSVMAEQLEYTASLRNCSPDELEKPFSRTHDSPVQEPSRRSGR